MFIVFPASKFFNNFEQFALYNVIVVDYTFYLLYFVHFVVCVTPIVRELSSLWIGASLKRRLEVSHAD